MNQTHNAFRNQTVPSCGPAGQRLAIVSDDEATPEESPFADNYEYLAALEKEALLMLVLSAVRSGKSNDLKNDDAGVRLCAGLGLTPQNITREHIETELAGIRSINRSRQNKTMRSGVLLFFPLFCRENQLDEFDEKILLLLFMHATSKTFRKAFCPCGLDNDNRGITIRVILFILCMDYGEQLEKRMHFSRTAPLVAHEIILFKNNYESRCSHVMDEIITINERHVRVIVGDNRLYNSTYNEISIEQSAIALESVVMPAHVKKPLVEHIARYLRGKERRENSRLDDFLEYGTALTFFFQGPSGTGKTMMARALAHHFNRPLITVNMSDTHYKWEMESILIQAFREAALLNGFIFFDEADDIFKEGSYLSRMLLIRIEKAKCVVILATNKAGSLDPALERRLSMKIHFTLPDARQRLNIWQALLPGFIKLTPDVNLAALNERYPFSGGLIKNTILLAANMAQLDESGNLHLTPRLLEEAADLQTRQMQHNNKFFRIYRPEKRIADLPLTAGQRQELQNLAQAFEYARETKTGLNLLLSTTHIETGIGAAEALAARCRLNIKAFKFSDMDNFTKENEMIDMASQEKTKLIDYAFCQTTEEAHLLMIVDDNNVIEWKDSGDEQDMDSRLSVRKVVAVLLQKLREYRGLFCLILHECPQTVIPLEFHAHCKLDYPPEEMQIRQWEKHLAPGTFSADELVRLVELHPLHIEEITSILRRASIQSIINGNPPQPALQTAQTAIERYCGKNKMPVLFGMHMQV
ncbi:MAG TPA: ATP-binding protein [Smithellaceae bacterium]|nr:ATP-binding protein [Smithellaceae bacterium]